MFCHSALCSPLLGVSITVLVCLNFSCLLVCVCLLKHPSERDPACQCGLLLCSCRTSLGAISWTHAPLSESDFSFSHSPSLSLSLTLWQTVPQAHSRPSSSYDFSLCQLTSVFCFSPNSPMPSRSLPSLPPIRPFSRLPLFSVQFLSLNQCCLVFQNKLTLMIFQHIVKTSFPCVDWSL